jgi:predicted transcriptional regulator
MAAPSAQPSAPSSPAQPIPLPVVRLIADLPADVAGQLLELAARMNANRTTALHEAIVLANLLYSEAAKRGKVVVQQGSFQKVIYLPKFSREVAGKFGIPQGRMSPVMKAKKTVRGIFDSVRKLFVAETPKPLADPLPVLRLTADLPADVAGQLRELAARMNANRTTALHEAIVLANLLYSEVTKADKPGKVVVKQGNIQNLVYLPKLSSEVAKITGIS